MKFLMLEKFVKEAFTGISDSHHIASNHLAEIASATKFEYVFCTDNQLLKHILIYTMLVYDVNPKYDSNTVNSCVNDFIVANTQDELMAAVHKTIDRLELPIPKIEI